MFKSVSKIKTTGSALFFNAVLMYFVDLSECIVVTIFYFVCVVLTFPRVAEKVYLFFYSSSVVSRVLRPS